MSKEDLPPIAYGNRDGEPIDPPSDDEFDEGSGTSKLMEALDLASGVLTQTLHGPVPMATTAKLAMAVLVMSDRLPRELSKEDKVKELILGGMSDVDLDVQNFCIWTNSYILSNPLLFPYPYVGNHFIVQCIQELVNDHQIVCSDEIVKDHSEIHLPEKKR